VGRTPSSGFSNNSMPLTSITLVSPKSLLYDRIKHFGRTMDTHIYKME